MERDPMPIRVFISPIERALCCAVLLLSSQILGCGAIPKSIRTFAAQLPSRAKGQYAVLDEPLRKQLVLKDALLQCDIDKYDGKQEDTPACKCATSSGTWTDDCKPYIQ
jgi:hypothetical protein